MDASTLQHRLARLEKQNRALQASVALVSVLLLSLIAIAACGPGQADTQADPATETAALPAAGQILDSLEVRELVLRDDAGEVAAKLRTEGERGVILSLYDQNGDEGARLSVRKDESMFTLSNAGKRKIDMEATLQSGIAMFRMFNHDEKAVVHGGHESGISTWSLYGEANEKGVRNALYMVMPYGSETPGYLKARTPALEEFYWNYEQ